MTIKIGINGFGRIGRNVLRSAVQNFSDIEVVAINDLLEPDYLAYMLQYDSVHGRFDGQVSVEGNTLVVNGKKIRLTQERDPANLKWATSAPPWCWNPRACSWTKPRARSTWPPARRRS